MTELVALRKFSTRPEGKVARGEPFETDRPEFFITHKIAEYASGPFTPSSDDSEQDDE